MGHEVLSLVQGVGGAIFSSPQRGGGGGGGHSILIYNKDRHTFTSRYKRDS